MLGWGRAFTKCADEPLWVLADTIEGIARCGAGPGLGELSITGLNPEAAMPRTVKRIAAVWHPFGLPTKSKFFLPRAMPRSDRSAVLLCVPYEGMEDLRVKVPTGNCVTAGSTGGGPETEND